MPKHPETDLQHVGEGAREGARPLTTPIYETSTFLFDSAADLEAYLRAPAGKYLYSRHANPTVEAAEGKIAALEGAEAALLLSSGMAAVSTTLMTLLSAGDEVLVSTEIYGGSLQLINGFLPRFGIAPRYFTLAELADIPRIVSPKTRAVWFESPTNPTLRCGDIRRIAAGCQAAGILSVIDNTFATPINQQPLSLGVDLVMHSATKFLNGHSDVVAGAVAGRQELVRRLARTRKLLGTILDPAAAYLVARGLKTAQVRIERQNASAMRLAEWLASDRRVASVCYPGLSSHPDHAIARQQMKGFGGMITIEPVGGYAAACRVFDRLTVFQRATSLGGTESLCSLPVLTSHYGFSDDQLKDAGVSRAMVRLSVGLEHVDDLIADMDHALA